MNLDGVKLVEFARHSIFKSPICCSRHWSNFRVKRQEFITSRYPGEDRSEGECFGGREMLFLGRILPIIGHRQILSLHLRHHCLMDVHHRRGRESDQAISMADFGDRAK